MSQNRFRDEENKFSGRNKENGFRCIKCVNNIPLEGTVSHFFFIYDLVFILCQKRVTFGKFTKTFFLYFI